jgi:hypothetical protein
MTKKRANKKQITIKTTKEIKASEDEHGIFNPAATSKKLLNKMDKIWDW